MTTTVQQIFVRARQTSPKNTPLVNSQAEILARIDADQQDLFATISGHTRDRFQISTVVTSTNASQNRSYDLSALTPPLERVLQITNYDGRLINQIDVLDPDAEFAPRYTIQGQRLVEWLSEWSTVSGAVTATLIYVYGPTAMNLSGDYTQTVTIPDTFADLLVWPLAKYFAGLRDAGPTEIQVYDAMLASRRNAFIEYLQNYGGVESRRFVIPQPAETGKK